MTPLKGFLENRNVLRFAIIYTIWEFAYKVCILLVKGKVKGEVQPRTGHKGSVGE
jgi:hypothetical protein